MGTSYLFFRKLLIADSFDLIDRVSFQLSCVFYDPPQNRAIDQILASC